MAIAGTGNLTIGPTGGAVTVGTANQLACPPNPGRAGLIFYNNSASAVISICPASQWTIASGTPPAQNNAALPAGAVSATATGVAGTNAPGSITLPPGTPFVIDTLSVGSAWNGVSTVPGGALTVLEF